MKRKSQGKEGFVALKLDMSKAFDRVELSMLSGIMMKFGFSLRWVNLIMRCVTTVKYHILAEGEEVGPIIPQRGIRQGDLLSPYLFILVVEGFTALIKSFERRGLFHGILVAKNAPRISHLLFVDDSFISFRANQEESQCCKETLKIYENASGQVINFEKSSIFFSSNVKEQVRESVGDTLGVRRVGNSGNYLGLPSLIGRNKKEILEFIKGKIINRIQS